MVMTDMMMKSHRHAASPPLSANESKRPAWTQPPAKLPSWPKQQKTAARVLSSDIVYQEPKMK